MFEDGGHVGGDEHLAFAEADGHPAGVAQAGRDQRVGLARRKGDDGAGPAQLAQGQAHGLGQRALRAVVKADQVGDDLGVGIRAKLDALGLQLGAQLAEVLDDAVLHHDHAAVAVGMRVGVALAGPAVRRPAGVADANLAGDRRLGQALRPGCSTCRRRAGRRYVRPGSRRCRPNRSRDTQAAADRP